MRSYTLALVAVLALVAFVRADDEDPDVEVLTRDNFDAFVDGEELSLVEFYAPWCGHCKRLAPEYAKAATELLKHDPKIRLGKVDATQHSELAGRFDVSGYPTLKVFRNGQPSDYNGPREAAGIVSYMKKQSGPAAKPVASLAELEEYTSGKKNGENFHIAGFFPEKASSPLKSAFLLLANKLRDEFTFVKSSDPDVLKEHGEGLFAFKTFDDKKTKYEGGTQTKKVEDWIRENSIPLIGEFSKDTAERYYKRGLPVVKIYTKVAWEGPSFKTTRYYLNRAKKLAETHRDKLAFTLANKDDFEQEVEELGQASRKAIVVIEDGRTKYLLHETFSKNALVSFVEKFLSGDAEKFVKSEEPPADNNGPVKVVTGRTFDEIVNDPEKDVLIEFYAPWCGHCKALAPTYEKLGKKFKKYDSVTIAKIDATANGYPENFPVSGYPSLFFVPAEEDADPIKYDGGRELDDMRKFVKKNAKKKLKKRRKK